MGRRVRTLQRTRSPVLGYDRHPLDKASTCVIPRTGPQEATQDHRGRDATPWAVRPTHRNLQRSAYLVARVERGSSNGRSHAVRRLRSRTVVRGSISKATSSMRYRISKIPLPEMDSNPGKDGRSPVKRSLKERSGAAFPTWDTRTSHQRDPRSVSTVYSCAGSP